MKKEQLINELLLLIKDINDEKINIQTLSIQTKPYSYEKLNNGLDIEVRESNLKEIFIQYQTNN